MKILKNKLNREIIPETAWTTHRDGAMDAPMERHRALCLYFGAECVNTCICRCGCECTEHKQNSGDEMEPVMNSLASFANRLDGYQKHGKTLKNFRTVVTGAFPCGASGKEPICQCRRCKRWGFNLWVGQIPWRRAWQLTPVVLLGEPPRIGEPGRLQTMGS